MEKWKQHILSFTMNVFLLAAAFILGREVAIYTQGEVLETRLPAKYKVVVDAGHGGMDPGKVGINGALEKDINLAIAKKLAVFLKMSDVEVVLTRESDEGLYDDKKPNKKVQDMKARLSKINEEAPELAVSIHQNSYEQESVEGAQVFYYGTSIEGKKAAEIVQQQILDGFPDLYHREAKSNESYYLLKKSKVPLIIVECGFLSNHQEAERLKDSDYQEKMAWQIHMAILKYLNQI